MNEINPLNDPEGVDPEGQHLRDLVEAMDRGMSNIGQVCAVFELCGHPLCQASVALFFELEAAREALGMGRPPWPKGLWDSTP